MKVIPDVDTAKKIQILSPNLLHLNISSVFWLCYSRYGLRQRKKNKTKSVYCVNYIYEILILNLLKILIFKKILL